MNNLLTASAKNIYTVCTCDPDDTIIVNAASLKVGVARKVSEKVAFKVHSTNMDSVTLLMSKGFGSCRGGPDTVG